MSDGSLLADDWIVWGELTKCWTSNELSGDAVAFIQVASFRMNMRERRMVWTASNKSTYKYDVALTYRTLWTQTELNATANGGRVCRLRCLIDLLPLDFSVCLVFFLFLHTHTFQTPLIACERMRVRLKCICNKFNWNVPPKDVWCLLFVQVRTWSQQRAETNRMYSHIIQPMWCNIFIIIK